MNKGTKAKQISEANEQKLPAATGTATETLLPAKPARSLPPTAATEQILPLSTSDFASITRPDTNTTSTILPTLPLTSLTRAVDRVEDLITTQALRLRTSGEESLQVILNPGAGLRISLDVRQQAGGIEVSASLQHGDFQFLNRHWSDLQQQLEARGIRLGPLTSEHTAQFGSDANNFHHRPPAKPADELAPVMKSRGLTLEGVVAVASVPRAAGKVNQWESWA